MNKQRLKYKIENWSEYNKSLIQRGSITLWFEDGLEQRWNAPSSRPKSGRPYVYSDMAMEICLTIKSVYHLTYRTAQGFIESLFSWGKIDLQVPSYSQVCRRSKKLDVELMRATHHKGAIDIVIDSTGLKLYGEGEWKVRQHGASKRRTWKKLHLGVDPLNHEIRCFKLTGNDKSDEQMFDELLSQVNVSIERCAADGAYDRKSCYQSCHKRGISLVTPPRCDAVKQLPTSIIEALKPRDEAISRINDLFFELCDRDQAREQWKVESDYHIRSIAENAMYRFKTLCGNKLFSRLEETQQCECAIKINIINKFTSLGMTHSTLVET